MLTDLARYSSSVGHEVHVIYSPLRADDWFVRELSNVAIASIQRCNIMRSLGVSDLWSGLSLRRAMQGLGPLDVIHAHSSKAGLLTRIFCHGLSKTQIYSPHGFYSMGHGHPIYGTAEKLLSRLSDGIIAVSFFEARHAMKLGISQTKISVVANGIDSFRRLPRAVARAQLGLSEAAFVVGFVGRLDDQKHPELAIEVADRLMRDTPIEMCIIGDGPLRAKVEAAITAKNLNSVVRLAGQQDARLFMQAFDCLLSTSRYEGMPIAFLEALASGVPIVTPPVGGALELVVPFQTGSIRENDAAALAAGIREVRRWLLDRSDEIRSHCQARAAHYSLEVFGDRTVALYRRKGRQAVPRLYQARDVGSSSGGACAAIDNRIYGKMS